MKVALLSDIHGNADALEAVLSEFPKHAIDEVWVLGDLTGYYYQTKKVLSLLKNLNAKYISGNHEVLLKESLNSKEISEEYQLKYGSSLVVAKETLSNEELEFLTTLPHTLSLSFSKASILLSHGSPWHYDDYIYPDASVEILNKFLNFNENIFFVGHTHYPMELEHEGKRIINPGSLGQPRNFKPGAQWAIFDTQTLALEFINTPYDASFLLAEIEKRDPENTYLKNVLTRTKK